MNRILNVFMLTLSFFMISSCNKSSRNDNDLRNLHLLGKVKQIKEIDYKGIGAERIVKSSSLKTFNEKGNIVKDIHFKGNNIEDYVITYKYDSEGRIATRRIYQNDSIILQMTWTYDGQLLKKYENGRKNGMVENIDYFYDDNDCCIKTSQNKTWVMDRNIKTQTEESFKYDGKNRCIYKKHYTLNKVGDTVVSFYKYNCRGLIANEKIVNPNGSVFLKENKYYSNGVLKEESLFSDDKLQEIRHYDSKGNSLLIEYYGNEKKLSEKTFKYRFDDNGNWIVMKKFANDKPLDMTERVIQYYN